KLSVLVDQPGVHRLAVNPDGRRLLLPGEKSSLDVWDIDSAKKTYRRSQTLAGPRDWVSGLGFAGDASRLVAASWDGSLRFIDLAHTVKMRQSDGPTKGVEALAVSRDGAVAAVAGRLGDAAVMLFDVKTGAKLWQGQAPAAVLSLTLSEDK